MIKRTLGKMRQNFKCREHNLCGLSGQALTPSVHTTACCLLQILPYKRTKKLQNFGTLHFLFNTFIYYTVEHCTTLSGTIISKVSKKNV